MKTALMVFEAILSIVLILCVVFQSGKSAGLSGSITGGAEAIFGGKSKSLDQLLAKATIRVGILFAVVTLILARMG